ncbi:MAG: thioredoxin family protein [Chloroflexi bacterium]|nr:thioredoxin family protein [Chloroflexota bacterium]
MPFISEKDRAMLKDRFKRELKSEVTVRLFTLRTFGLTIPGRECRYCDDTQKLMEELTSLSPKLRLGIKDFYASPDEARAAGVERIPALVFGSDGANVKFYGIPLGREFAVIVEDLFTLSRGVSPLSLPTRKKLKQVTADVRIQVFVTPACVYCPPVARMAHAMAMENPRIRADVVEVEEFPLVAQRYLVQGVPKTVINEKVQFVGAVPEAMFADKVLEALGIKPQEPGQEVLPASPVLGPTTYPTSER